MKKMLKILQKTTLVGVLTLCLTALSGLAATAEAQSAKVFSPDANVFGMSYGDWSAAWWQYVLSIPVSENPVLDETGEFCGIGQSGGPIFFLVGAVTGEPVTRDCTAPAGKALVVPILNVECSNVEDPDAELSFYGGNAHEMRMCAAGHADNIVVQSLNVTIDRKKIQDLRPFRVQSPLFDFNMPEEDNFLDLSGVTSGSAVSDGYWIIIEPLRPGEYELHFEGEAHLTDEFTFYMDVTYNLTVQ